MNQTLELLCAGAAQGLVKALQERFFADTGAAVNARFGRGTLRSLATGLERAWGTRHSRLSARYTTRVEELMVAEAW